MKRFGMAILLCAALSAGVFTGCTTTTTAASSSSLTPSASMSMPAEFSGQSGAMDPMGTEGAAANMAEAVEGSAIDTSDLFTDRDLEQVADTSNAKQVTLTSGEDVTITEEGVYVISGTATDVTITVQADDSAKVQLVLDGASITNSDAPAIYVASADKVFVTTVSGTTSTLKTTGEFAAIGEDNVDGVIFAKDDLVLNGEGTLVIESSDNAIVGKDDVKVTGGTYNITAVGHGIEGKDRVAICGGVFTMNVQTDGVHSENTDDQSLGIVYISDGQFDIQAGSDGIEGDSVVQIDGGTLQINSEEGIEGTYVQINGGVIGIQATDDGINATSKSTGYGVMLQITGGEISIEMAQGDTDALDSNGNISISGGTVNITAQSPFDFDGTGELTGGTVTVNGEQVTELTNQMMGGMGGMGGGRQGGMNGMNGMSGAPQGEMGSQQQGSQEVIR